MSRNLALKTSTRDEELEKLRVYDSAVARNFLL